MIQLQAIVLAAGEGSRMRPLTSRRPKVMLPVGGRPFLEEILARARAAGVTRIVLVVGYHQEVIRDHFGSGERLGMKIEYVVQDKQLGTGHALSMARDLAEDRFLVLNGDVLPETSTLQKMISIGRPAAAAFRVADPRRFGVFLIDGDCMAEVVEKSQDPPSNIANAGIYLLDYDIFLALEALTPSARGEFELTDGLNQLAREGAQIQIVEMGEWIEIGRPWDILDASRAVLSGRKLAMEGEVEAGATLLGSVAVGKGTRIRSGSYIDGRKYPIFIGPECNIGPNCYIREGTCIGRDVRVGNAVEVKNSTVMDGTKIGHLSYVGDSVIGETCNFGAGTILANLRHDGRNVKAMVKGELVDSGRRKLGVIMGDGVKTGIHTTIYPGTVIEAGYRSLPGAILKGHVEL